MSWPIRNFRPVAVALVTTALLTGAADAVAAEPSPLPIADLQRTSPVDFDKEILPILSANCLACHNRTKAKADLVLEMPADMLKGGENGPAVVPKRSADSLLLKSASHQQEPVMPPKGNKAAAVDLTPEQLGLLKLWIDQGARASASGAGPSAGAGIVLQPLPEGLKAIYAVGVTPDGQFAACARANQVYVYRLPTHQPVAELVDPQLALAGAGAAVPPAAHRDVVQSIAFSPDGTWLATGGFREVKLWRRPRDVRRFAIASAARGPVGAVASTADGTVFATGGADGVVRIWDGATRGARPVFELSGHAGPIDDLRFSPDGLRVASVAVDKTLRLWSVADGAPFAQAAIPGGATSVAWTSAGKRLVTAGADGALRVWNVPVAAGGEVAAVREMKGHGGPVTCVDSIPGAASQIISGGADGSVRIWNVDTGETVRKLDHGGPVAAVAVRPDGKRLASAGLNHVARLWDADGKPVAELKGEFYATETARHREQDAALAAADVAYRKSTLQAAEKRHADDVGRVKKAAVADVEAEKALADKRKAATAAAEAEAKIAADVAAAKPPDADAKKAAAAAAKKAADAEVKKLESTKAAGEDELRLAIKAAQQAADALADAQGALQTSEADHKRLQDELPALKAAAAATETPLRCLAFSLDGLTVATAGDDALVHTWSAETGAPLDTFKGHAGTVAALAFVAGDVLVSGSADGAAIGWDLRPPWQLERTIGADPSGAPALADRVNALDFSPDGRLLATGGGVPSREGEIVLWDVNSGALVRKLDRVHSDTVLGLDFSPDGKRLASGSADRFVKVLDLAEGKVVHAFEGHTGHVLSVAFRRDGRALASGGADHTARLWDVVAGAQTKNIAGFEKEVTSVQFLADTDQVLATAGDGKVRLLKPDGGEVRSFPGAAGMFVYAAGAGRDGTIVVAGGEDGVFRGWEAATAREFFKLTAPE